MLRSVAVVSALLVAVTLQLPTKRSTPLGEDLQLGGYFWDIIVKFYELGLTNHDKTFIHSFDLFTEHHLSLTYYDY